MKCPKCGYISFDYNQVCPKCNKDISSEQAKLKIPPFQPSTPSLLGALTGDVNESQIGLRVDTSSILEESLPQGIPGMVDTSIEETGQFAFDDTEDTQIDFEGEEALEPMDEAGESEVEFGELDESALEGEESFGDLELESDQEEEIAFEGLEGEDVSPEETGADLSLGSDDDFSLDLGDFSDEEGVDSEAEPAVDAREIGAEDLTLELSKASIEESVLSEAQDLEAGPGEAEEAEGTELGPEGISLDKPAEEGEFDLGDLSFEAEEDQETDLKIDEIFLEETPAAGESDAAASEKIESETGIDLDALDALEIEIDESEKAAEGEDEIELDLDDLKINETGELEIGAIQAQPIEMEEPEEILLEEQARPQEEETLTGLEFEAPPAEKPAVTKKPSGTSGQGLEDTLLELEEISLSEEPLDESGESEMTFDLEDLDLDLEFEDEPEDDKKEN